MAPKFPAHISIGIERKENNENIKIGHHKILPPSIFIVLFRGYKIVHVDFSQEAWRMKGLLAINCSFFKTAVKPSFTCEFAEVEHRE